MTADAAALQVLISRLAGVAEEMGAVLRRAAFSPNIKERADCSAALFTPSGELLVQAEHIPVHLGSMPASVRSALSLYGTAALPRDPQPGDQVVLNDPFAGGTHLNDVTVVAPAFTDDGALLGWAANRAHHADLGGMAPGSIPPDATEIQQEGLRIPPVLLGPAVVAMLAANSRTPVERAGDLDAQVGANAVGVARLAELAASMDDRLRNRVPFEEVLAYGERRMRAALAELPDGSWEFSDVLDSSGPAEEQRRPCRICVTVTIDGDCARFDFTGTDPQGSGNINAVEAVTVSAVAYAVRAVTDPTIPANGGALRPVSVIAPAGTVVAAVAPAAVGAGNVEVSARVADVCMGALAKAVPSRVGAASQGTMNNVMIGSAGWVYYETIGGGQGGRPGRAGMSGIQTGMTNTSQVGSPLAGQSGIHTGMTNTSQVGSPLAGQSGIQTGMTNTSQVGSPLAGQSGIHTGITNTSQVGSPLAGQSGIHTGMTNTSDTPVEAFERTYPMRVLRYRLRRGSGGAGAAPGGEGIEKVIQVLEPATLSLVTERRVSQPWGLAGGGPGAVGENWLWPGGDESRRTPLPDKVTIRLEAGDAVQVLTPGGGGWGNALSPSPASDTGRL